MFLLAAVLVVTFITMTVLQVRSIDNMSMLRLIGLFLACLWADIMLALEDVKEMLYNEINMKKQQGG